jgi:DNA-directed RNA polymerase beta subunit
MSPDQAGEMLLREHIFIHLMHGHDKLATLLAMSAKLLALVGGLCCEDNADALSHHEVLLPGTLLSKFMSDKLAECLDIFKRQVRARWLLSFPFPFARKPSLNAKYKILNPAQKPCPATRCCFQKAALQVYERKNWPSAPAS